MGIEKIEWEDIYSVGVLVIDNQHKKLLEIINNLNDIILNKKDNIEEINNIIKELYNYAETHFKTEEEYMERYHYPEILSHKILHNDFIKKIKSIDLVNDTSIKMIDIIDFLYNWLINHIMVEDKKYMPYFVVIDN